MRVQPRAPHTRVQGVRAGALVVKLSAPPVEGRANEALCRFLAGLLALAPSAVELQQGARGRDKVVLFTGVEEDVLRARLLRALEEAP